MNSTDKKQVLIIGGGFAGLNVAKALGNKNQVEVTIVDRRNYHLFQPLLYQVATAGLSPADIATPIRDVLSKYPNVNVALDEITGFDAKNRIAKSKTREYKFDYAVVACGSSHSYFGKDDWEDAAPGLKTLEQATEIRRRILTAFEKAEIATDENLKTAALTFVVIGGGPTGVELSGSIAELARGTLNRDFRHFDPRSAKIILIEGGSRLVSAFPEELSANALKSLQDLGVQVRLGTRVTGVSDKGVNVGDEFIPCHTILWAAGVATNPIARILPGEKDQSGRVVISIDLSIPSYRNIFVLGDMAHFDLRMGKTLPGLAPVALQQGRHAAKNILNDLANKPREDFVYLDKGIMATIGRQKAVVQVKDVHVTGTIAWLMWLFVHVFYLIGFKNRFSVMFQWAWSYFTYKRGSRLITEKNWH